MGNLLDGGFYSVTKRSLWYSGDGGTGHQQENLAALELVPKLTPEAMERIDGILGNKPDELERY